MKKRLSLVLVVLLIVGLTLTGCSNQGAANQGGAAAPDKVYEWTVQSAGQEGSTTHEQAVIIANRIKEASGGRLDIKVLPIASVVAAPDAMDAVNQGTLDGYHGWLGYWNGQIPAISFFAGMPAGLTELEYMTWMLRGGGDELLQELVENSSWDNIRVFAAGAFTQEVLFHSKVPISNLKELQGKKVRGVGVWGEILAKLGASPVAMAGNEVFPAFERGVVDAIEWSNVSANWLSGFHEVGKYIVAPGIHQPSTPVAFVVNKERLNELPADLQALVETVTTCQYGELWSFIAYEDSVAWQNFEALAKEGKIEILEFDKEDQKEVARVAQEVYAEKAKQDPFFGKVLKSQQDFLKIFKDWKSYFTTAF
jgi:TRAP-type mannitol/chloroaromatic compound transport system substrate-binding protein